VTGRQRRRRTQLLDYVKEIIEYWKLKEEALDSALLRTGFGRSYGPVVRQENERILYRLSLVPHWFPVFRVLFDDIY
jgi:hypothetical protein